MSRLCSCMLVTIEYLVYSTPYLCKSDRSMYIWLSCIFPNVSNNVQTSFIPADCVSMHVCTDYNFLGNSATWWNVTWLTLIRYLHMKHFCLSQSSWFSSAIVLGHNNNQDKNSHNPPFVQDDIKLDVKIKFKNWVRVMFSLAVFCHWFLVIPLVNGCWWLYSKRLEIKEQVFSKRKWKKKLVEYSGYEW